MATRGMTSEELGVDLKTCVETFFGDNNAIHIQNLKKKLEDVYKVSASEEEIIDGLLELRKLGVAYIDVVGAHLFFRCKNKK